VDHLGHPCNHQRVWKTTWQSTLYSACSGEGQPTTWKTSGPFKRGCWRMWMHVSQHCDNLDTIRTAVACGARGTRIIYQTAGRTIAYGEVATQNRVLPDSYKDVTFFECSVADRPQLRNNRPQHLAVRFKRNKRRCRRCYLAVRDLQPPPNSNPHTQGVAPVLSHT
jgi:hypothetical protein